MRAKDGALAQHHVPLRQRARRRRHRSRGRARRRSVEGSRASRSTPSSRTRPAHPADHLRHRRLGHRLGSAERQQPRPARRLPLRARAAPNGTNFAAHRQRGLHAAVDQGDGDAGTEGCPTWVDAEAALVAGCRRRAVRQQRRATTFGKGAEFECTGQHRSRRASGCSAELDRRMTTDRATRADRPTQSASPSGSGLADRWVRFAIRRTGRLLVSLWVLVTAAFLMIHLIPGDPVRAALGPTAPPELVAAAARGARPERPALAAVPALPAGAVHRRPRHLDRLAAPVLRHHRPAAARHRSRSRCSPSSLAVVDRRPARRRDRGVRTRRGRGRRHGARRSPRPASSRTIPDFLLGVALVYVFGVQLRLAAGRRARSPGVLHPAGDRAGDRPGGGARAHRPRRDARRARRRLRPHRARQAAARAGASTSATRSRTRSPRPSRSAD